MQIICQKTFKKCKHFYKLLGYHFVLNKLIKTNIQKLMSYVLKNKTKIRNKTNI